MSLRNEPEPEEKPKPRLATEPIPNDPQNPNIPQPSPCGGCGKPRG